MSKKGSDTPASIRIRENQRRSRNQRKELIQDLQRRVQEYEAKGIAATQEMQRAARKVAEENARLKSLLTSRGVAYEEVEAYLRSFDTATVPSRSTAQLYAPPALRPHALITPAQSPVGNRALPTSQACLPTSAQVPVQAPAQPAFQQSSHPPPHHHVPPFTEPRCIRSSLVGTTQRAGCDAGKAKDPTKLSPDVSHESGVVIESENSSGRKPAETQRANHPRTTGSAFIDHSSSSNTREDADCPNTTSCFCPPTTVSQELSPDTSLVISCETAATIISEMRGDSDRHRIRASLGCHGDQDCSVKNTLVLELMDER